MKTFKIILLVAFAFFCNNVNAQAFEKGDVMISPGIGIGVYGVNYGLGFSVPVMLNADIGVHDYVSVGAYGGFWTKKWDYTFSENYRYTSVHVGGRASFHWWKLLDENIDSDLKSDKLDIYITPWLGYNIRSVGWSDSQNSPTAISASNRVQGGAQIGIRYFFNEHIGVFGEWGGTPTAYSNWGLSLKF